jgi:N utilization substance protein A
MGKEILLVADSVANEKGLAREIIFRALELAIAAITAKRYHPEEPEIRVAIDHATGDYETFRQWTVVEDREPKDYLGKEMPLTEAQKLDPELTVGDVIEEPTESIDFGRIAAQQAKQIILREIRQAERDEVAKQYQDKIGTLVIGKVKSVNRDSLILDMGDNIEAVIPKEEMIPHEVVRTGDRLRGLLINVRNDRRGPQLLIARTRPEMLIQLFKVEVPEISEDVIEIKAVARDPGSRAKIAVKTNDGRIDPIGACIGIRGSRVQTVSNELNGERVDIILWDDDPAQLVINAMAPAEVSSIVVDEDAHSMDIAVREDQLAQAIGRNGQNVQLASKLSGWTLNVMTEAEVEKKNKVKTASLVKIFTEHLGVDEDLAEILVQEGFTSLEDIAYAPEEELLKMEGMEKEIIEELRNRARNALLAQALGNKERVGNIEPAKDLLELEGMSRQLAYLLASHEVITREDLAEKSVDELSNIEGLDKKQAAKLIMQARSHWFE